MKKLLKNKKGVTLVELLIAISLIGIILLIIHNILFISIKSYKIITNKVEINRELRYFLNNIQKEISQARKANDNKIDEIEEGSIFIKDNKYFCIYVDLDSVYKSDVGKPYLVQYYLKDNKLMRRQCKTIDDRYPYINFSTFTEPSVVLGNLVEGQKIEDIFRDIEILEKESNIRTEYSETRKSVVLKLKIKGNESKINEYQYYLFTKSKVEFE